MDSNFNKSTIFPESTEIKLEKMAEICELLFIPTSISIYFEKLINYSHFFLLLVFTYCKIQKLSPQLPP